MELITPTPEQALWGLRAMKTVATADGALDASELHMLESIQRVFGTSHALDRLEPVTPAELASALPDPRIRRQLVHGLVVMSLIDRVPGAAEATAVEQFAAALDVSLPELRDLRLALAGDVLRLRLDIGRRFWAADKVRELWREEGLRGMVKFLSGALGREDATMAARYQALESYPAGSLGRAYFDYSRSNGFPLPGEKGGSPEIILFHDCTHVLSGYGTTPDGEVQVACFSAGYRKKDPFAFVFFVLLQFHVGVRMTPITTAQTGFFDPEKALIALRRGAAMNVDLTDGWDYWPVMGEQIEDLRTRYGIPPLPPA
jgi:hypothetical protein